MKNQSLKFGLFSLIVLAIVACKPKIDMDFVNNMMNMQSKITETVTALKGSNESMMNFKGTMAQQIQEMTEAKAPGAQEAAGLLNNVTSLLGERAGLLNTIMGLSGKVGDLLNGYKGGKVKLKDAKSQFEGIQNMFNENLNKVSDSDSMFNDYKGKFMKLYQAYKEMKK